MVRPRLPLAAAVLAVAVLAVAGSAAPSTIAATATAAPDAASVSVSMSFSGDVLLHRPIIARALADGGGATYDFSPMFARIAPLVSSLDLSVCHLETPIAPPGEPLSSHPIYGVPREIVPALAGAGFDRCTTASNHSFDRGTAGIDATVNALEAAGIGVSGMARTPQEAEPQVFAVKGVRFANLDYTFSLNGLSLPADQPWRVRFLDPDRILADARLARERGAEYVIVSLHWGEERAWQVTDAQRQLANVLTASGLVDLVEGEHVHVLQPIEQLNGRWVVYGTSNLLSNLPGGDASFPPSSQDGAIVTVSVTRGADGSLVTSRPVVHPTWVDHADYTVRPVLDDLADPATPPGVRAELEQSLARTRAVLGAFVPGGPAGTIPARCDTDPAAVPAADGFTVGAAPARYVPLDPVRIYDSRDRGDDGYLCPGSAVTVPVVGRGGVPEGATAVAVNVTAIDAGRAGFATVWPAGTARPTASNLNLTAPGQVRPNLAIVPLGTGGALDVYAQSGMHLALDVAGYFVPSASTAAGRVVAVEPARVLDTRLHTSPTGGARVAGGATLTVPIAGLGGVPAAPGAASAVVVNLTATDAVAPGFVTAWPSGAARPVVSNVNLAGRGDTSPNLAIVRLGAGGAIDLYAQSSTHLVADVVGYVTGDGAPVSAAGRFVPIPPARALDTREPGPLAGKVPAGGAVTIAPAAAVGISGVAAGAVVLNVTAVDADAAGFVTVHPAGRARPQASTVNVVAGDVRPNAALALVGEAGAVTIYVQSGAHLAIDVAGYLTAAAEPVNGPR